MTNSYSLEDELTFAGRLADAAWSAIRPHFRALDAVDNKITIPHAEFDPVTAADTGAEAAMRASVAEKTLDETFSGQGRAEIELDVRERMQRALDAYNAGITVIGELELQPFE